MSEQDKQPTPGAINFNIQGNVNQAAGQITNSGNAHVGDVNNYAGGPPIEHQIVTKVAQVIADLPEDVATSQERESLQKEVVEPLEKLSKLPKEEQEKPGIKQKAMGLIERLKPYGPQIGQGLLTFGEAALTTVASANPILGGLLAAVKVIKSNVDKMAADQAAKQKKQASNPIDDEEETGQSLPAGRGAANSPPESGRPRPSSSRRSARSYETGSLDDGDDGYSDDGDDEPLSYRKQPKKPYDPFE